MVDVELSINKCDNFIRPHKCDYSSKASKWSVSLCFRAYVFELVAARFYAFVEAAISKWFELAWHLTNRDQTSYELKVIESMRIFVEIFCMKYENCLKRFQVVFQLWRVCYIRNVEIFEKLGFLLFNLKLNSVLDQFFELVL